MRYIDNKIKELLKEKPMSLREIQRALSDENSGLIYQALNPREIYSGNAELLRTRQVIEKDGKYCLIGEIK